MLFVLRRPAGPLAGFVRVLWFYEGPARPHAKERLLPDGSMELVINLHDDEIRVWDRRDLTQYERLDGAVAFITGRSVAMVDRLFSPLALPVAGLYGLEHRLTPGGEATAADEPADLAAVERITHHLAPRGPDAWGFHAQGPIALGHRRLKIMDLSNGSAQPMIDNQLGLSLAFNGAIYNFPELRTELESLG